ncbi:hypothetical protein AB0D91_05580 [Streptomyces canus]|uniref:hypothetical protein n=1 Tax=Streptomyces canus TaxID=58343 RepID=UPI0033C5E800
MNSPTRVIQSVLLLGGTVDDIALDVHDGHTSLVLGKDAALCLSLANQDVLDKLAVLTAQAAADKRATTLKAVS